MRVYQTEKRVILVSVLISVAVFVLAAVFWKGPDESELVEDHSLKDTAESSVTQLPESANPVVVCLGDSYTYGYPDKEDTSWPKYMEEVLGSGVDIVNAGKVKQTSKDLLERFVSDVAERQGRKANMVIIFAGMGDALNDPPILLTDFQENISQMVDKAKNRDITPVLVMPFLYPDKDKQEYIDQYRRWLTTFAESEAETESETEPEANLVRLVDIQGMLCDEQGIKKQYTDNGKYPNHDGYKAMGKYIAEQVKDKIA